MIKRNILLPHALVQCYNVAKKWRGYSNVITAFKNYLYSFFETCIKPGCWRCCGWYLIFDRWNRRHVYKTLIFEKKITKKDEMLQKTREGLALEYPEFYILCPARWTVLVIRLCFMTRGNESLNLNIESELREKIIKKIRWIYPIVLMKSSYCN